MGQFRRQMQWNVTRSVAVASLFYVLYNGGKACLFPFLTLYFRDLGLTATQTGIVFACKSLIWYFSAPIWITVAKRIQKTRVILCIALLATIASNLSITVVPPYDDGILVRSCIQEKMMPTLPVESGSVNQTKKVVVNNLQSSAAASLQTSQTPLKTTPATSISTNKITSVQATSSVFAVSPTSGSKLSDVSLCRIVANLASDVASDTKHSTLSIERLISMYNETALLSPNEQKQVVDKMSSFLQSFKTIHQSGKSLENDKVLETTIIKLITSLLPTFLKKKCLTPELTAAEFIKMTPITSALSQSAQNVLIVALEESIAVIFGDSSSTTTTVKTPADLSSYQIAALLAPRVANDLVSSNLSIADLLLSYKESKNLPKWKQSIVAKKIRGILESKWANESDFREKRSLPSDQSSAEGSGERNSSNPVLTTSDQTNNHSRIVTTVKFFKDRIMKKVSENAPTFLLILIIVCAGEILSAPIEMLSDNSLYELLDELDSLNRYGKHRLAGLFGIFACGISVSVVVYFTPCIINETMSRFHIHFYAFAGLVGLAFALAPFYPAYSSHSPRDLLQKIPCILCPSCSALTCTDCRHTLLLISVFIVGITQSAVQNFIFWEAQDLPGSSQIVYGSFVSAGALSAMIAALFGRRLMTFIKPFIVGPITLFFVALQLVLFSFLFTPWMIVPLQFLSIFGQSLMWTLVGYQTNMTMSSSWKDERGSMRRVNDIHVFARASQQRALYTAYVSTYQGLSFAIGSVISGLWYDLSGGSLVPVLRGFAVLVGVWACIYMSYQCCCLPRRLHNKYSKLVADSEDDDEADEEDDIYDAGAGKNSWYTRTTSSYASVRGNKHHSSNNGRANTNSARRAKTQRRYSSTSSEDEMDDRDWLSAALKKEDSRML